MALTLEVKEDVLRQKTREVAKRHRASWIELGQYLLTIHKDKHFKNWGFLSFEAYCMSELGMKQATASKLLKSYSFLEREEPRLASAKLTEDENQSPKSIPNYESVNLLRLAKESQKISPHDYADLRKAVLESGKEPKEIKAQVKQLLEDDKDTDSPEAKRAKRNSSIRRLVSMLNSAKREFENEKIMPSYLLKQISDLIGKLEDQLE
ncbi:MAG: hypothetical protein HYZ83_03320 [Candidatus Omnitrophica bacterium]|nr:hypothetical protein [Candidatus Omnitrophota bacterium]